MKITLQTHGGLAAGIRRAPLVLDTADLPTPDAASLAEHVAAAQRAARPRSEVPGPARDAMSYTIHVEDGGDASELTQSDASMTPEFEQLLQSVQRYAKH